MIFQGVRQTLTLQIVKLNVNVWSIPEVSEKFTSQARKKTLKRLIYVVIAIIPFSISFVCGNTVWYDVDSSVLTTIVSGQLVD